MLGSGLVLFAFFHLFLISHDVSTIDFTEKRGQIVGGEVRERWLLSLELSFAQCLCFRGSKLN